MTDDTDVTLGAKEVTTQQTDPVVKTESLEDNVLPSGLKAVENHIGTEIGTRTKCKTPESSTQTDKPGKLKDFESKYTHKLD